MSAVRKFMAPGHLQTLLFAPNIKLQDIFTIIGEWEEMQSRKRANRREMKQENYKVKIREKKLNDGLWSGVKNVKCYRYGKYGHISPDCSVKEKTEKGTNMALDGNEVGDDKVKINGLKHFGVFDTGSTHNLITTRLISKLPYEEIAGKTTPLKISMLNGGEIESTQSIMINIEHKSLKTLSKFWVINDRIVDLIVGRKLSEILKNRQPSARGFPVVCEMKTPPPRIVSITRPIKSFRDKTEFYSLIKDLERKGILEESSTNWVNRVRLTSYDLRWTPGDELNDGTGWVWYLQYQWNHKIDVQHESFGSWSTSPPGGS